MKKILISFIILCSPLASHAQSIFKVQQGGTGTNTFAAGQCLVGNGTGAITTSPCNASSSFAWPFLPISTGVVATTSQINLAGFLSTASSTIVGSATTTGTFTAGFLKAGNSYIGTTTAVVCKTVGQCDYQTITAAIAAGNRDIFVKDGTYAEQVTLTNTKTRLRAQSLLTIIQCNGATQSPCVQMTDESTLDGFTLNETNAQLLGVAIDSSDHARTKIYNNRINNFATSTRFNDTTNVTFYNEVTGNTFFNVKTCYEFSGTLANANWLTNNRCRPMAVDGAYGLYGVDVRGISMSGGDIEGTSTTKANVGIYLDATSRDNTFNGVWEEALGTGVSLASGSNNNSFFGMGFTSNASNQDIIDNGTNNRFVAINKTGTKLFNIGAASSTAFGITGLATPAGAYLAVDPSGSIIATTTPTGGSASSTLLSDLNTWSANNIFTANVGIGTSSPGTKLEVDGGILVQGTAGATNASFGVRSGDYLGYWDVLSQATDGKFAIYDHKNNTNPFYLAPLSTTNSFYMNTNGSIGFLTSAGQAQLHVWNPFTSTLYDPISIGLATSKAYQLVLQNGNAVNASSTGIGFSVTNTFDNIGASIVFQRTGSNSMGDLIFYNKQSTTANAAPTESLRLKDSGNVGIGLASPSTKLEVNGSASSSSFIAGSGAFTSPSYGFSGVSNTGLFYQPSTGQIVFDISGSKYLGVSSGSTNVLNSLLVANGSAATPAISSTATNDQNTGIYWGTTNSDTIAFANDGAESGRFTSTGLLGLGTTSPFAKLTIWGTTGQKAFEIANAASTSIFSVLTNNGTDSVTANGKFNIASTSNVYYKWVKPLIWSIGSANQTATANTWYCERFELPVQKTVTGITYTAGSGELGTNGSAAIWQSNNGSFTGATLKIGMPSATLTATSTTNFTVTLPVTSTVLSAGDYFACVQLDSSTASFIRQSNGTVNGLQSVPLNEDFSGTYATGTFATYFATAPALTARTINGLPNMMIKFTE